MKSLQKRIVRLEGDRGNIRALRNHIVRRRRDLGCPISIEALVTSAGLFVPADRETDDAFLVRVKKENGHNRFVDELADEELTTCIQANIRLEEILQSDTGMQISEIAL